MLKFLFSIALILPPMLTSADEVELVDLLEGDSLELWQGNPDKKTGEPSEIGERWSVKDGVLHLDRREMEDGSNPRGGFITTKKKYYDFEFTFEFMIAHNGNSGVKYRVDDTGLGLEYQIIDDVNYRDNKNPTHRTAGLYDLVAPDEGKKKMPPAGEGWNEGRIVADGASIEHWINGELVMSVEYGSDDWKERFENSKYKKEKEFGANPGSILLQDHQDTVSFRKLKIREIAKGAVVPASVSPVAFELPKDAPPSFMNCMACHLLEDVQVGPSLVEMAQIYPAEGRDYFIEWCVNPGKKRPEMAQMPSMAHVPKEELGEIHDYILKATKGMKVKKNYAKSDGFVATKRPRIVRTFVPESGPASIVICLDTPEKHNVIWDTDQCRLRYVTKGEIDNWPYLRSNGNALADVGDVLHREPKEPTHDSPEFLRYTIKDDGTPIFRYRVNGREFGETFSVSDQTLTVERSGAIPETRTISLK